VTNPPGDPLALDYEPTYWVARKIIRVQPNASLEQIESEIDDFSAQVNDAIAQSEMDVAGEHVMTRLDKDTLLLTQTLAMRDVLDIRRRNALIDSIAVELVRKSADPVKGRFQIGQDACVLADRVMQASLEPSHEADIRAFDGLHAPSAQPPRVA